MESNRFGTRDDLAGELVVSKKTIQRRIRALKSNAIKKLCKQKRAFNAEEYQRILKALSTTIVMRNLKYLIILILLLCTCKTEIVHAPISFSFREYNKKVNVFDLIREYNITILEESPFSRYRNIHRMFPMDNKIMLWARGGSSVKIHGKDGEFIKSSPPQQIKDILWNEIKNIDYDTENNMLYVADILKGVYIYDLTKDSLIHHIKEKDFFPTSLAIHQGMLYVITNNLDKKGFLWVFNSSNFQLVSKFIQTPLFLNKIISFYPFSKFNGYLRLNINFDNLIYTCNKGKIFPNFQIGNEQERLDYLKFDEFNSLFDLSIKENKYFYHLNSVKDKLGAEGSCYETSKYYFSIVNKYLDQYLLIINKKSNKYIYIPGQSLKNGRLVFSFYQLRPIYIDDNDYLYFSVLPSTELLIKLKEYLLLIPEKRTFWTKFQDVVEKQVANKLENPLILKCKLNFDVFF